MNIEVTKNITDRDKFVAFVNELYQDFLNNPSNWENKDLASFLEALGRYAEDIDGHYKNTGQTLDPNNASWKVFADMLLGARIYE